MLLLSDTIDKYLLGKRMLCLQFWIGNKRRLDN
jgi:hypothetical protein